MKTPTFIALLTGSLLLAACEHETKPVVATTGFCIPDSLMRRIAVDTVRNEEVENELQLNGKVTFDENKVVNVYPLVSGNVTDVKVELGDYVKQGQTLAVVRSSEVAGYERDRIAAQSDLNTAQKSLDVTTDMATSGLATQRDVLAAQNDVKKARSELARTREIIGIYGIEKNLTYSVRSPIAGFIVSKNVADGMQLRPDNGTNLFTISDLKRVWVIANVYETDIAKVREGNQTKITTLSYPDQTFTGKIEKMLNVLDPESKVMRVRVVMDNPNYLLKPEMFANVLVDSENQTPMPAIPTDALVFDKSKNFVVVYQDRCGVAVREVNVFKSLGKKTYLSGGLKPGEKILTTAQLMIYNALIN